MYHGTFSYRLAKMVTCSSASKLNNDLDADRCYIQIIVHASDFLYLVLNLIKDRFENYIVLYDIKMMADHFENQ